MYRWILEYTVANPDGTIETVFKYFNRKPGSYKLADVMSYEDRKVIRFPVVYPNKI